MASTESLLNLINRVLSNTDPLIRLPGLERLEKLSEDSPELFDKDTVLFFFINLHIFSLSAPDINRIRRIFTNISKSFNWDHLPNREILQANSPVTIEIISTIFPFFNSKKKSDCLPHLLELICRIDCLSEEYMRYKKSILSSDIDVLKKSLLDSINKIDATVYSTIDIMSNINDEIIIDSFIKIYKRLLDGEKYGGRYIMIHQIILNYFSTYEVKKSYFMLLKAFQNIDIALIDTEGFEDAVVTLFNGNLEPILFCLKENKNNPNKFGHILNILIKIDKEKLKVLDAIEILNIIHENKTSFLARHYSEILFSKLTYNIALVLKKLYHGNKEEYEFARKVILLREESVYDYDKENSILIISQIILDEIQHDKEKDNRNIEIIMKSKLKDLKKDIISKLDKLEYLIMNLLIYSKFITFYIDYQGTKGVDIIAISPQTNITLLIGCTTASISNDDVKLTDACIILSRKGLKMDFIPVIATPLYQKEISNYKDISDKGIKLLTKEKIDLIYEMAVSNRPHIDILEKICESPFISPK